ncbi:MAG: hypothetical protein JWR61_3115, partial [Ferruginibacter sp.]|uniref:hypothetical protein n=1 Tax=Ferruginibacter sp. TaxID=1940288 RepID=UPI002659B716
NGQTDYKKLIPAYEGRFYFDQDKVLRTIRKGKGLWDSGQESILSLQQNTKRYIGLLYKKNKKH